MNENFRYGMGTGTEQADAKRARDQRARELRKQGYKVTTRHWDFSDLARGGMYQLTVKESA